MVANDPNTRINDTGAITHINNFLVNWSLTTNDVKIANQAGRLSNAVNSINIGIQSNYNGAKMAVDEILDSNSNLKYMVKANKGCLTVPGNNKYKITNCDSNDLNQYFIGTHIYSNDDYASTIDFGTVDPKTNYPFLIMQSQSNRNCLTNKPGGISVEPCTGHINQQWSPF